MTDWFDRIARLAALGERITTLTDGIKALAKRVEDHHTRLVRLETIIEITRPDGAALPARETDPNRPIPALSARRG